MRQIANDNYGKKKPIPVILDTDIGGDIDDTWALAMMLKCPELDPKLVVTDTGDTRYRAKIVGKMLEIAGRTDIPIGIGIPLGDDGGPQEDWVADYDLDDYPGEVYEDGVGALIDTIMQSPDKITLICIGPVPNIGKALSQQRKIASKARFVGMHGSIRKGYGGSDEVSAEYNVKADPTSCQKAFTAPWEMTITPVDTCGLVHLTGEKYQEVLECDDPVTEAVIENYRIWARGGGADPDKASSTLFDTVAIYLTFDDELLVMERLPIRVTDDGYTVIDEGAKEINCAMEWKDMGAFEDLLVERLTG